MLIGTYQHSLDDKGRVNFPAKLREGLGSHFIITKGLDGCLFVYPEEQWKIISAKINDIPLSKGKEIQRFFFSGATDVEPDKQGRIVIPSPLRDYASLEKEVVIIGASTRAEIWDTVAWAQNNEKLTDASVMEMMDEIGF